MVFPILVMVGTLFSAFGGASSKKTSRKEDLKEDNQSMLDVEEAIRREIQRKKEARSTLEPKRQKQEEAPVVNQESFSEEVFDKPTQFQVQLEKQASQIKAKQAEAKRLKANLEQRRKGQLNEASKQARSSAVNHSAKVSKKVRAVLENKQEIKAALIAGEILAQPLALRTDGSARSTRF